MNNSTKEVLPIIGVLFVIVLVIGILVAASFNSRPTAIPKTNLSTNKAELEVPTTAGQAAIPANNAVAANTSQSHDDRSLDTVRLEREFGVIHLGENIYRFDADWFPASLVKFIRNHTNLVVCGMTSQTDLDPFSDAGDARARFSSTRYHTVIFTEKDWLVNTIIQRLGHTNVATKLSSP